MMFKDVGIMPLISKFVISQLCMVLLPLPHTASIISMSRKFLIIYLNKRSRGGKRRNIEIKHDASWCDCDQATLTLLNREAAIKGSTAVAVPTTNLSSLRADYMNVCALRMTVLIKTSLI